MAIELGPILNFRGSADQVWKVSALIAVDGKATPVLTVTPGSAAKGQKLGSVAVKGGALSVWRFDIAIPQEPTEIVATYAIDSKKWKMTVPAVGVPPRMAYGSCNGFSSLKLLKSTKEPNALWKDVEKKHKELPFHLLLLGGDQVYSDAIWEELRGLTEWASLPTEEGIKKKPSKELAGQIKEYYEELYPRRWAQPEPAEAFATIPTVMMWDDHDIFDGWGSYEEKLQRCDMYKALFASARDSFSMYQQQIGPGERHPLALQGQEHYTMGFQVGTVAVLALDMRSERSSEQVMSPESWKAVYEWMSGLKGADETGGVKHLFVLSSIPVVYPDFQLLEQALGLYPGRQELEDDLRDHWTSGPHRYERVRLIHRLLAFSAAKSCRVTVLSGDVHVGAVGVVRSDRTASADVAVRTLNQLTSSGIVHPAPPGMVLFFLEHVVDKISNDDSGVTSKLVEIPGTRHHFIGARNWLALQPDHEDRYWANWHVEGEKHPFTKVVHPVGFEMPEPKLPKEARVVDASPA